MGDLMIKYLTGDLFNHNFDKDKITLVPHVTNYDGVMGSGFAAGVNKHWPSVKEGYEAWYNCNWVRDASGDFQLGQIQTVKIFDNLFCINMLAQRTPGGYSIAGKYVRPIVLECLAECMLRVLEFSKGKNAVIVAPKFGSLRAGADWNSEIVPLIDDIWADLDVTIYDFGRGSCMNNLTKRRLMDFAVTVVFAFTVTFLTGKWWMPFALFAYSMWNFWDGMTRRDL
jgi:hypothetical protein